MTIRNKPVPKGYRIKRRAGVVEPFDLIYSKSKNGMWVEARISWAGKPVSMFETVITPR